MNPIRMWAAAAATVTFLSLNTVALAHGIAGQRFFPATILTDDPFVADEISLPQVTVNPPGPDGAQETDIQIDLSKRITPNLGVTIGDQWQYLQPKGLPRSHRLRSAPDRRAVPALHQWAPRSARPPGAQCHLGTYRAGPGTGRPRFHDAIADL